MHVGRCVCVDVIKKFLDGNNIKYYVDDGNGGEELVGWWFYKYIDSYKHGSANPEDRGHLQTPVSPRERCTFMLHLNWLTQILHLKWPVDTWWQVNLDPDDGKSRLASQTARKREISRDFSRFFDPAFFRSFIDPFCPFRCCVWIRTGEMLFLI